MRAADDFPACHSLYNRQWTCQIRIELRFLWSITKLIVDDFMLWVLKPHTEYLKLDRRGGELQVPTIGAHCSLSIHSSLCGGHFVNIFFCIEWMKNVFHDSQIYSLHSRRFMIICFKRNICLCEFQVASRVLQKSQFLLSSLHLSISRIYWLL